LDRINRWIIILVFSASSATAQDASTFLSEVDSVLTFDDSLSVFTLIDSLLELDELTRSELAVRLAYNSNVLSAGRTLGIENFGLSPGISYYHKFGFFADVSAFWSKDFDPSYYLTIASVGYTYTASKKFSLMGGYDRYFYNQSGEDLYIPYKNDLTITPILDFKPVTISVNYAFYFGDATAHRIMPSLMVTLEKRNLKGIDRIALLPSFYALMGNEIITEMRYPDTLREYWRRYRQGLPVYDIIEHNEFGMLNYTFSAPLLVSLKNWNFTFTYNYSIPKALPGETLTYSESSFLSGSLTYFIGLKSAKKTFVK